MSYNSIDNTFRTLKQIPYSELRHIVDTWVNTYSDRRQLEEVLEEHGWTIEEYDKVA